MKAAEPTSHGSQPSADVVIRAARTLDVEAITAMSGLPGFRAGTLRLPFQAADRTRKFLEEQGENDMLLVAERDGVVVGSAGWKRFTGRRLHAAAIGMGVHDDHVGQGIGSALLGALIDAADNWYALVRLELTVYTDNAPAIRLYQSHGFETEGTLRGYAFKAGRYVDALAMARVRRPAVESFSSLISR